MMLNINKTSNFSEAGNGILKFRSTLKHTVDRVNFVLKKCRKIKIRGVLIS